MPRPRHLLAVLFATLLTLLTAAPAAQAASTTPRVCKAGIFYSNAARNQWYRIPAVVHTTGNNLVAFAERRAAFDAASDTATSTVFTSRSTNGGCTWSKPTLVAAHGSDTVGNPVPLFDTRTQTLLLFTVDRPLVGPSLGVHLQRSDDNGRTFTPYQSATLNMSGVANWHAGLTGPGHALQLTIGPNAGRIIVPMGYVTQGHNGAYNIMSDDDGTTWRVGDNSLTGTPVQEGTAAQLPNGDVWVAYRVHGENIPVGTGHYGAISRDGGATLTTPLRHLSIPTIDCEGSAIVLTGTGAGTLLYSNPGLNSETDRRGMTIFSTRNPMGTATATWHRYPVTPINTPASYSDLVQINSTTVGIIYETGHPSWHNVITWQSIPITKILGSHQ